MQHDIFLTFALLVNRTRGVGGGMQAKYLHHVTTFRDSIYFDMHHDHVLKKLNFDLFIPSPGSLGVCVGGGGAAGKIVATVLLHFVFSFNLICNMTMF